MPLMLFDQMSDSHQVTIQALKASWFYHFRGWLSAGFQHASKDYQGVWL